MDGALRPVDRGTTRARATTVQTRLSRRKILRRTAGFGLSMIGLGAAAGCDVVQLVPWQHANLPRIGYLGTYDVPFVSGAFRQGLGDYGYVDGQNIDVQLRFSDGDDSRFPELARELIRLGVAVIVTSNPASSQAAIQATQTLPIVTILTTGGQFAGQGLATRLAKPDGNVTGPATLAAGLISKQVELIGQVVPRATRLAVLSNPDNPSCVWLMQEARAAAAETGLQLRSMDATGPDELENVLRAVAPDTARGVEYRIGAARVPQGPYHFTMAVSCRPRPAQTY